MGFGVPSAPARRDGDAPSVGPVRLGTCGWVDTANPPRRGAPGAVTARGEAGGSVALRTGATGSVAAVGLGRRGGASVRMRGGAPVAVRGGGDIRMGMASADSGTNRVELIGVVENEVPPYRRGGGGVTLSAAATQGSGASVGSGWASTGAGRSRRGGTLPTG